MIGDLFGSSGTLELTGKTFEHITVYKTQVEYTDGWIVHIQFWPTQGDKKYTLLQVSGRSTMKYSEALNRAFEYLLDYAIQQNTQKDKE